MNDSYQRAYTIQQLSPILGFSEAYLYWLVRTKRISIRDRNPILFTKNNILEFFQARLPDCIRVVWNEK